MQKEKRKSSDAYSEKLIPTRVTIARRRGDFTFVFEIDGYRGEQTGEISYKASEVKRVENVLASNPSYEFTSQSYGLVLGWESPTVVANESAPTGTLARYEEIFKLQPRTTVTAALTV